MVEDKVSFGFHERAIVYTGSADFQNILEAEVSGDFTNRLPNIQEEAKAKKYIKGHADTQKERCELPVMGNASQK